MEKINQLIKDMVRKYGEEETYSAIVKAEQRLSVKNITGSMENPYSRLTWNLTRQGELSKGDPDLAEVLKEQAQ